MKSGKSTLLNTLLFDKPLLPNSETVMTAKITILEYREEPGFEAEFYSSEEWEKVRESLKANKEAYSEFQKDIEIAAKNEIYYTEHIRTISKRYRSKKLSELIRYVGTREQGGILSPFVKQVKLYHPNPILEDITFVDTPGVNDPNQIRSKITEEWLQNANAVLFVTYAGAAFDESDVAFIDEHLIHISSTHRLLVVNKMDTVSDADEVKSWVNKLKNSENSRQKAIFSNSSKIVYVSALGSLLNAMIEHDALIDKKHKEELDLLKPTGYLASNKNNISELKHAIGERIMLNKGDSIIESHSHFVRSLYHKRIKNCGMEKAEIEDQLKDIVGEKAEQEKKRDTVSENIDWVSLMIDNTRKKVTNLISDKETTAGGKIDRFKNSIVDEISTKVRTIQNVKDIRDVPWELVRIAEEKNHDLVKELSALTSDVEKELKNLTSNMRDQFANKLGISFTLLNNVFLVGINNLFENIEKGMKEKLNREKMFEIIKTSTKFFQRWFNTRRGRKNVISEFLEELNTRLDIWYGESLHKSYINVIQEASDDGLEKIEEKVNGILKDKKNVLDRLIQGIISSDELITTNNMRIREVTKEIERIRKLENDEFDR